MSWQFSTTLKSAQGISLSDKVILVHVVAMYDVFIEGILNDSVPEPPAGECRLSAIKSHRNVSKSLHQYITILPA